MGLTRNLWKKLFNSLSNMEENATFSMSYILHVCITHNNVLHNTTLHNGGGGSARVVMATVIFYPISNIQNTQN